MVTCTWRACNRMYSPSVYHVNISCPEKRNIYPFLRCTCGPMIVRPPFSVFYPLCALFSDILPPGRCVESASIVLPSADATNLYSKIVQNGYKVVHLTDRPLPCWHATNGGAEGVLPPGPLLCPPEVFFRNTSAKDRRGRHEVRSVGGGGVVLGFRSCFSSARII